MNAKEQINNRNSNKKTYFNYDTQDTCPICKAKIEPIFIAGCYSENKNVYIFDYCRSCKETFISTYSAIVKNDLNADTVIYLTEKECLSSEPNRFVAYEFDKRLLKISPRFVEIYNQSLEAESYKLNEIAGMGYRKAIEFLVKDFAIHQNPTEQEKIESDLLSHCINEYMPDNIKTLLERLTWIGNDETHYIRKHEDYNITDMKIFIDAAVYFINMILVTEEAELINPIKD